MAKCLELRDHGRHGRARRMRAGRIGVEFFSADLFQDRLRHQRACRVVGAQKQDIERGGHRFFLRKVVGEQAVEIAAQFRASTATGFGEKTEQRAQAEKAHRVDHMASAARGLNEMSLFERGEMERKCRGGLAKRVSDLTCCHAGRPTCRQKAHQIEACFLC